MSEAGSAVRTVTTPVFPSECGYFATVEPAGTSIRATRRTFMFSLIFVAKSNSMFDSVSLTSV